MFCPKCGSLLMPKDEKMVCGSCKHISSEGKLTEKKKQEKKIEIIEKSQQQKHLPKIKAHCEKCNNNEAYFHTMQTRSSDEPETKFFKCTKCSYSWREY